VSNSFLYALLTEVAKVVLILAVFVAAEVYRSSGSGNGPRDLSQSERNN
jgi:hypothetical protein